MGQIAAGRSHAEALGEEVGAWRREDCRGRATLAEAASSATRYELELRGLKDGPATVPEEMRALGRVRFVLERTTGEEEIVEVELAEDFMREHPKARGFRMGELKIGFEPTTKRDGVVHFLVSHPFRYPTWEELGVKTTSRFFIRPLSLIGAIIRILPICYCQIRPHGIGTCSSI